MVAIPPTLPGATHRISVQTSGGQVDVVHTGPALTILVHGILDADAGECVVCHSEGAVSDNALRLDLDLRGLTGHTPEGLQALLRCRDIGAALVEGVHYRTGDGAGRAALIEAHRADH